MNVNFFTMTLWKGILITILLIPFNSCEKNDDTERGPALKGSITANDQLLSEASTIFVEKVEVNSEAWIVVRTILFEPIHFPDGYSEIISEPLLLEKGTTTEFYLQIHNDANVDLEGATAVLMLYEDDGDGVFEESMESDRAFTDIEGKPTTRPIQLISPDPTTDG